MTRQCTCTWLQHIPHEVTHDMAHDLTSCISHTMCRFYDRDVSAALNIRRCAVGPGPRPTELCYWDGRPAMPKPGRPGQEWVYLRDKALLLCACRRQRMVCFVPSGPTSLLCIREVGWLHEDSDELVFQWHSPTHIQHRAAALSSLTLSVSSCRLPANAHSELTLLPVGTHRGRNPGTTAMRYVWDGSRVTAMDESLLTQMTTASGRVTQWASGLLDRLQRAFLPDSKEVTPDYWEWLRWRLTQRFFSSTMQNLSTQSLLLALGMGAKRSIAAGAAINWLLKDGVGRVARMAVATNFGQSFDSDLKARLSRSGSCSAAQCRPQAQQHCCSQSQPMLLFLSLPLLLLLLLQHFLLLASVANVGKAIALAAFVATAPAFQQSLCNGGNLADLTAKNQAQHMVVDMLALAVSAGAMWWAKNLKTPALLPLLAFPLLASGDLYSIYRELKSVQLCTLNRERAEIIAAAWLSERRVPLAAEARLRPGPGARGVGWPAPRYADSKYLLLVKTPQTCSPNHHTSAPPFPHPSLTTPPAHQPNRRSSQRQTGSASHSGQPLLADSGQGQQGAGQPALLAPLAAPQLGGWLRGTRQPEPHIAVSLSMCDGLTMLFSMAKKKRRTVPRPVPEDPDSDIEDRDEALQPDLTEAQRNKKASGEARAARDRDNTYHGRKVKLAHLIDHLPQALWDAFLADAVQPRVEAISERGVLASLLLGLLVRGLFTIRVADPLGLHDPIKSPVATDTDAPNAVPHELQEDPQQEKHLRPAAFLPWQERRERSYARMQGYGVSMEAFLEALNAAHYPLTLYPSQQIRIDSFSFKRAQLQEPVYTDIPVSQAAIPDLSCRNLFLQLVRGLPGNGAYTQPNAAVAAVLAAHPDLRARLAAIPRHLSDSNMVNHVGKQLETAFSNILTLLFAGRLKKSVSLAGAKVLVGTEEHRRRFGFWGVEGGGHLPAWSKRECTYVRRMVCGLDVSWLLEQGGVVPTPSMQAEVALQRGLLGLEEGERVDDDWVEDPVNRGRLLRHAVHTTREMEAAMAAWQLDMVPWQQAELGMC
ncbi:hypothetical protein QJQ45_025285, partial [Haematococcus lacustris]